jgi:hypothetical protein
VAIVLNPRGGWPQGLFSLDGGDGQWDYVTSRGFSVGHSHTSDSKTYAVALTQGYGEIDCNLAAAAATGQCQVVTFTRPVKEGAIARAYLDGRSGAWEEIMEDLPVVARQSAGYRLAERVPAGYHGSQDLYELLVYDRVLSDDELKSLHSYLLLPRKAEPALEK